MRPLEASARAKGVTFLLHYTMGDHQSLSDHTNGWRHRAGNGEARMSIAQAQARLVRVPFATWLGMTLVDIALGRVVLALPFQPAHTNASGPLNGGASASLLLMAGTIAAWTDI